MYQKCASFSQTSLVTLEHRYVSAAGKSGLGSCKILGNGNNQCVSLMILSLMQVHFSAYVFQRGKKARSSSHAHWFKVRNHKASGIKTPHIPRTDAHSSLIEARGHRAEKVHVHGLLTHPLHECALHTGILRCLDKEDLPLIRHLL